MTQVLLLKDLSYNTLMKKPLYALFLENSLLGIDQIRYLYQLKNMTVKTQV
jgi:hypothetical protein